jgi:hypothetical protein
MKLQKRGTGKMNLQPKIGSLRWHLEMLRKIFIVKDAEKYLDFTHEFVLENRYMSDIQYCELVKGKALFSLSEMVSLYGSYYEQVGDPRLEERGYVRYVDGSISRWIVRCRLRNNNEN